MSQYPKYYVEPVYKKEDQNQLVETGEYQKLTHLPTKAALIDQSCSPSHDKLIK